MYLPRRIYKQILHLQFSSLPWDHTIKMLTSTTISHNIITWLTYFHFHFHNSTCLFFALKKLHVYNFSFFCFSAILSLSKILFSQILYCHLSLTSTKSPVFDHPNLQHIFPSLCLCLSSLYRSPFFVFNLSHMFPYTFCLAFATSTYPCGTVCCLMSPQCHNFT